MIEVEVDTLEQFDAVLPARPDIVLLDNMSPAQLREAVARRNAFDPAIELEASGGVDLSTVRAVAESGVERISVGALTHSAAALDFGLDCGNMAANQDGSYLLAEQANTIERGDRFGLREMEGGRSQQFAPFMELPSACISTSIRVPIFTRIVAAKMLQLP